MFPEPGVLAHVPSGDRVAYDALKGRVWVICRTCRRWSLLPLEARWEALEELEELTSGNARLLARTKNISLYRKGPLEIVRVGGAGAGEEAWWRYGNQTPGGRRVGRWTPPILRTLRFGSLAWVGERSCPVCGHVFREVAFNDRKILRVAPADQERLADARAGGGGGGRDVPAPPGSFSLHRPCPRCKGSHDGGLRLAGLEAEITLARVLAFQNYLGESQVTVQAAARLVADPENPMALVRLLSRQDRPLGDLQPIGLTALEIAVNAARERTLSRLEAEALEARWKREEELASLVDGELSPVASLGGLVRKIRGV